MERLEALRAVLIQEEHAFGTLMGKVLSASRPLQSEESLRGRESQLNGIKQALYQPGRHILIHGYRGVGKSSLAQTAAFGFSKLADPIVIGCDNHSTFVSIMRDIFDEAAKRNPVVERKVKEPSAGFERFGIHVGTKITIEEGKPRDPASLNEAVRLMLHLCETYTPEPVIVIDEFDQIQDKEEQRHFTNFIKQVSDRHVPARFLFCGIGESIDDIMAAHASADRYFHMVGLGQLPWEARFEIVNYAADRQDGQNTTPRNQTIAVLLAR